jgi:hypothetical protein
MYLFSYLYICLCFKVPLSEVQSEELYLSQREVDEDLDRYLDSNDLKNHLPYGNYDASNKKVSEKSDDEYASDANPSSSTYSNYGFKKNDGYDTKINTNNFEINGSEIKKENFGDDGFIDINGYKVDKDDHKMDRNGYGFNAKESERNRNEHKSDESDWRAKYDLYANIRNTNNVTRDNYKSDDYNNYDSGNDDPYESHIQSTDIRNPETHDKWRNLTRKSHVSNGKIIFQSENYDKNDDDNNQSKNEDHNDDHDKDKVNNIILDTYSHDNSHDPGIMKAVKRDGNDNTHENSELIACNISKSIEMLRSRLIEHLLMMDIQLDMIKKCLFECSEIYRTCVSKYSQNLAFDELTARVGAGHRSMTGTGDWRNSDIPGYRYVCVQILCTLSLIKKKAGKLKEINRKKMISSHIGEDMNNSSNVDDRLNEENDALDYDEGIFLFF